MHYQIALMLFCTNVSFIFSQRLQSTVKVSKHENIGTPSPEWIKYQQERFDIKAQVVPDTKKLEINKTPNDSSNPNMKIHSKHQDKLKTTPRQSTSSQEQQQAEFETMILNSQKPENVGESNEDTINSTNGVQFPSIRGFIEFLKSLKKTWMKNSIFGIDDKIKLLQNLKDSLMKTIEQQFMVLWQDDDDDDDHDTENKYADSENIPSNQNRHLRRKRGILDESNINFPPDAALMSINFLTFAVFLIKLVLQVVHIIKSKHYQLSSLNMTDSGAIRNTG